MGERTRKYYENRQVINMSLVSEGEYADRVFVCIPAFAWRVARAYLSRQAQWESSYAVEYSDYGYTIPDAETMDKIKASIDAALAEDDMSCDIVGALEDMTSAITEKMEDTNEGLLDKISELVAKDCGVGCGGSGGAGVTESEPSDFEDDGENYPDDFESRSPFLAWKCGVSKLIVDQIINDIEHIKDLAITEITASALGVALLTPIPLDDAGVLVGVLITYFAEDILDDALDAILNQIGLDYDTLLCSLYNAISSTDAVVTLEQWADTYLSESAEFLFNFFVTNDNVNRLFEERNLLLPSNDCEGCQEYCEEEEISYGTGTIYADYAVIDSEQTSSVRHTAQIAFDRIDPGDWPSCGIGVKLTGCQNLDIPGIHWRVYTGEGTKVYDQYTIPTSDIDNVTMVDATHEHTPLEPFSVRIDWERY